MKEDIINLINENDVVSFDIFDTLVFRNISKPTDIFKILDRVALNKYNIKNFYEIRINAEKESRTTKNNYECNFDEIYNKINVKISNKKITEKLKNEELKLENKFLVVNPFMKEIFDYCISKNKKILIISDMYLNEKFIINLLNKFGYKNYRLYLSNVYRKAKGDSSLFDLVFNKENIKKDKWLHIGDNEHSDFYSPKGLGINAFCYKNVNSYRSTQPNSIFESIILGIQNNYIFNGNEIDYWDKFGVLNVSTIYFGFTKWLYDLTKNKDNLFFIARDGYIIDKIFKLFNSDINTHYLYCSRNSLVIPSLYNATTEELVNNLMKMYNPKLKIFLSNFLKKCYIDVDEIDFSIITSFGFKTFDDIIDDSNIYNLKKLLVYLSPSIKKNLFKSFKMVKEYLIQEKLNDYSEINIMDIGWAGSIQYSIKRLLNKNVNGYYFGTVNEKQKDGFSSMFGYYFDLDHNENDRNEIIDNVMMYELIFTAPHATTKKYEKNSGIIKPILDSKNEYNKIIEKFQKSAINIIKEYLDYIEYFDFLSKYFCTYSYRNFIKQKNFQDILMFSNISNDYILNNNSYFSYVSKISVDESNDASVFVKKCNESLWPGTFIVDEENYNEEKHKKYIDKYYSCVNILKPFKYMGLYFDYGKGFCQSNKVYVALKNNNGRYSFRLDLTCYSNVKNIKILLANKRIILKNLIIFSNLGGSKVKIPHKNYIMGKLNKCIYIDSDNPEIIIKNTQGNDYIDFSAEIEFI